MNANSVQIDDIGDTTDQYLTFLLGDEEFGLEILSIQEIKSWGNYTPLPNSPDYILGVINLRGAIVPIIDLRLRLGLPRRDYTHTTAIIIVRVEMAGQTQIVGLVVDQVSEVYHLAQDIIQSEVDAHGSMGANFIKGLARLDNKLIILLNLEPVLGDCMDQGAGSFD